MDLEADAQDRLWLRDSAAGDRAAFAALYRHHHRRLVRFLGRFTTRRDLVDDVINDALWIVWCKAAEFRGESRVSTWITGIAYRCMLKALRDRADLGDGDDELPDPGHDQRPHDEQRDWIARGLRALPQEQRVTLELAYFMGESCEDIAAIMGCAVGTVKARLFHARVRLRTLLPALGGLKEPKDQQA
jgi:RNA polymerase sigma-70 factor (ECF subfamily)